MAFQLPITGGDNFQGRHVELNDPPSHAFLPVTGTDYATTDTAAHTGPSRFVIVATTGSYTFTTVGGETSVAMTLTAGVQYWMRMTKVETAAGTVVFLY